MSVGKSTAWDVSLVGQRVMIRCILRDRARNDGPPGVKGAVVVFGRDWLRHFFDSIGPDRLNGWTRLSQFALRKDGTRMWSGEVVDS